MDESSRVEFDRYAAAQEMLREEYKRYQAEISQIERLASETERNFVIAIAAIYTWLYAPPAKAIDSAILGAHAN